MTIILSCRQQYKKTLQQLEDEIQVLVNVLGFSKIFNGESIDFHQRSNLYRNFIAINGLPIEIVLVLYDIQNKLYNVENYATWSEHGFFDDDSADIRERIVAHIDAVAFAMRCGTIAEEQSAQEFTLVTIFRILKRRSDLLVSEESADIFSSLLDVNALRGFVDTLFQVSKSRNKDADSGIKSFESMRCSAVPVKTLGWNYSRFSQLAKLSVGLIGVGLETGVRYTLGLVSTDVEDRMALMTDKYFYQVWRFLSEVYYGEPNILDVLKTPLEDLPGNLFHLLPSKQKPKDLMTLQAIGLLDLLRNAVLDERLSPTEMYQLRLYLKNTHVIRRAECLLQAAFQDMKPTMDCVEVASPTKNYLPSHRVSPNRISSGVSDVKPEPQQVNGQRRMKRQASSARCVSGHIA